MSLVELLSLLLNSMEPGSIGDQSPRNKDHSCQCLQIFNSKIKGFNARRAFKYNTPETKSQKRRAVAKNFLTRTLHHQRRRLFILDNIALYLVTNLSDVLACYRVAFVRRNAAARNRLFKTQSSQLAEEFLHSQKINPMSRNSLPISKRMVSFHRCRNFTAERETHGTQRQFCNSTSLKIGLYERVPEKAIHLTIDKKISWPIGLMRRLHLSVRGK